MMWYLVFNEWRCTHGARLAGEAAVVVVDVAEDQRGFHLTVLRLSAAPRVLEKREKQGHLTNQWRSTVNKHIHTY